MRKKIKFYRALLAEICETLCTICFDEAHNPGSHSRMRENYMSHFYQLKSFSEKLRGKEAADGKSDSSI